IKGMLSGIGIIIILKQIPHFFGYDADPEGDWAFFQVDGENTFSEIINTVNHIQPGSALIGIIGLAILIFWDKVLSKKGKFFQVVQGPLVAVVLSIVFYVVTKSHDVLAIASSHLVSVPVPDDISSFLGQFSFPNFSVITNPEVWIVAFTIALVASLETLLCVEATDKLDPNKNVTPT
ncbi:MAG: SulP family inorganic anion transporter, partial [Flavobacteriaceae bacterium]|nr:SulP family inorganic anion transporter [Flavobacteriaceae bacterium]